MSATILIIEDERPIIELLEYNLHREGYRVESVTDGEAGLAFLERNPVDLVILDLMLPGIQGLDVCRMLRERSQTRALPIIMLTAKAEEADKILGLEIGADDYVTKPFSVKELLARIRALIRRTSAIREETEAETEAIVRGALTIDQATYSVTVEGKSLRLSPTEFKLLKVLASRPGRVYTRDELLDLVWGDETFVEPRTVDVHIRRLRASIEADHAQTMIKEALDAFVTEDPKLAIKVCKDDEFIDNLNDQIYRELLTFMIEDPKTIGRATKITFVSKYLERIADQATNIAELVVYLVEGKDIRHMY